MTQHAAAMPTDAQVIAELEKRFGFKFADVKAEMAGAANDRGVILNGCDLAIRFDPQDADLVLGNRWRVRKCERWGHLNNEVRRMGDSVTLGRLITGCPEDAIVTFRNGDDADFRRSNLVVSDKRIVRKKPGCIPDFKGVYLRRAGNRWFSRIMLDGRSRSLGTFDTEVEAAKAYDNAARRLFGASARLNFPGPGERGC